MVEDKTAVDYNASVIILVLFLILGFFVVFNYYDFIEYLVHSSMTYNSKNDSYEIGYDVMINESGDEEKLFITFVLNDRSRTISITRKSECGNIDTGTATVKMLSEFGQKVIMRCNNTYAAYLEEEEKRRKLEEARRRKEETENKKISDALGGFFEINIESDPEF